MLKLSHCGMSLWLVLGLLHPAFSSAQSEAPPATSGAATSDVELDAEATEAVAQLRKSLPSDSEAIVMLDDILLGKRMTKDDGWFKVAKPQSDFEWDVVQGQYDSDGNGSIDREEFPGSNLLFERLDRNSDQKISAADHEWGMSRASSGLSQLIRRADRDDDGRIRREELLQLIESLPLTTDEYWSTDDLRRAWEPPAREAGRPSDAPTPSQLVIGLLKQEIGSWDAGPSLGEVAPDFTLKTLKGVPVTLSTLSDDKPTVLIFGNFTCGPFRGEAGNLERLYETYGNDFNFLVVYVREAHPSDGWAMTRNESADIVLPQPQKYEERVEVATRCQAHLGDKIPLVVDDMDDPVGGRYSGMPSRLYLLDQERQVRFKSGRGPHYFFPAQLEWAMLWYQAQR